MLYGVAIPLQLASALYYAVHAKDAFLSGDRWMAWTYAACVPINLAFAIAFTVICVICFRSLNVMATQAEVEVLRVRLSASVAHPGGSMRPKAVLRTAGAAAQDGSRA